MERYDSFIGDCLNRIYEIVSKYEKEWQSRRDSETRRNLRDVKAELSMYYTYGSYSGGKQSIEGSIVNKITTFLYENIEKFELIPKKLCMPDSDDEEKNTNKDRHIVCNAFLDILDMIQMLKNCKTYMNTKPEISIQDFENVIMRIKIMDVYDV